KKDFLPLVGYSFSLLGRIGKELSLAEDLSVLRNITLLGIRFDKKDESILKALIDSTRASDAFFVFEDLLVLLLFGTNKEGAIHIVNELKEFFGQNMFYAIATSPEDGDDASTLVENFRGMVKLKLSLDIYTL
ncbi:MAG: hypothetical protein ACP5LI_06780, partial [Hydrogenobaculum sp.]